MLWLLIKVVQHPVAVEALKCTETYGTPSFEHIEYLKYTEFLNYKTEIVKHRPLVLEPSVCVICVDSLFYQQEPGEFCVSVSHRTGIKSRQNNLYILLDSHFKI